MGHLGTALARGPSARSVAARAASLARARLGDAAPSFALVYATEQYPGPDVLAGVREALGPVPVAGCTAPGVFCGDEVTRDGVAVLVLGGDALRGSVGTGADVRADPRGAAERAATAAVDPLLDHGVPMERLALVLLPDAICGNAVEVARGASDALGAGVHLVGGGSGDNLKFAGCWQFTGAEAVQNAVVAVALGSRGRVGTALRHGCRPYGPPATVTRSSGRVVHEIEWDQALRQYVAMARRQGDTVTDFISFAMLHPFGIPEGEDGYVLRSPIAVGEDGAIHCCSDVPQDGVIRVMEGDVESLLDATTEAARDALTQLGGALPELALLTACVSRDFVLGGEGPSREIAAARRALGGDVPVFGALLFGQLGRQARGRTQFHSKAVQVCLLTSEAG